MNLPTNDTVALFGLPITNVTMSQAIERVEQYILSGRTHQIATANLDFARNALKDPYLQQIICSCSMVLPDGAPMLWASSLFGKPLQQRVTGVDLVPQLASLSARKGYGIFLLGSSEASSAAATKLLEERYPGVRIVGRHCPPIGPLHSMDHEAVLQCIEASRPDILLVAFGNPKQEIWIHRHKDRLKVPVAIGIGGSLDMIAGSLRRAPRWVQKVQMEWAYRMVQEPRRLLPRYAKDGAALIKHLPMGLAANRLQPGERRQGKLTVQMDGLVRVVRMPSKLTGKATQWLREETEAAVRADQIVILDFTDTIRVEADGLGSMLEARRMLLAADLQLWLTGMSNPVRRVLQFCAMSDLFRIVRRPEDAIGVITSARASTICRTEPPERAPADTRHTNASIARAS